MSRLLGLGLENKFPRVHGLGFICLVVSISSVRLSGLGFESLKPIA